MINGAHQFLSQWVCGAALQMRCMKQQQQETMSSVKILDSGIEMGQRIFRTDFLPSFLFSAILSAQIFNTLEISVDSAKKQAILSAS